MPGAPVTIQFEPPVGFILKQTGRFRHTLEDLTLLWPRVADAMEEIESELFATQDHGAWPGLADSTLAQKARDGFPSDPLVRTGALRDSLVNAGSAADYGPDHMSYGTDVDYAHWHQEGGTSDGRPPQRKVIDLRVEDRRKIEVEIVRYVNEAAALTFGRI